MTKLEEYAKRLGVETSSTPGDTLTDINAGKAGYDKYLADVESYKKAQEQAIAESEANKSWWKKASDFILQANQMSSNMSDNPAVSGFNAAVEAYKNMPEDNKPSDDWTDEERWIFGEKYASDSKSAYDYAKRLNAAKAQQKREQQAKAIERWTNRNAGNQILGSAASIGLNATMGGLGFLDAMAQMAGRGEIQQHDILLPHEIAGTMQGAVASDLNKYGTLNEKIPIIGGKGWGDVYGLGMSIAQSKLAVTAGGGVGSLAQFFGMSASQGVSDALERGATGEQALAFGTVSGLAEAIPEMISLDKFIGIASSEAVESVFKNVLKMAGEEAGEELTTSLITEVADRWIMGGKSEFQLRVNELVASGMSLEEAKKAAWKQTINNIAFDTLSGAISGGVSGALGTGVNRVNQRLFQTEANETAKKALTPEQDNLITEAKKYDTTKKRASALEKKLAEGKELTGYDLRMLANQVSEASRTADVETTRRAIVTQMKDGGLSDGEAKKLGEIALNKAIGNEVSKVQDLMLKRSEVGTKVYNQISADVMQSGAGDSEWAKRTPIERLRAEKEAIKQNSEIKVENKPKTGLEQLKTDIAAKYGVKATDYKINTESLEGKIEKIDGGYAYKKSSADSKIHTEGITSPLTEQDIAELSAIEKIANDLGIDIHVYETKVDNKTGERSYTDKDGKKYSDSGFYNRKDNSIHIDLRAGENGEGTMLYTASHEVVHFIKENASEQYEALEKFVTKELIQGGFSIDKLIDKQKDILRKNGWDGTESDFDAVAREEMVAEACQSFLASKNAVAEIRALKSENRGLWNALKKFFTSLFAKINKIYKELPPDAPEGEYIAEMRNAVKPIRDAFMEGAVAASKNAKSTTKQTTSTEVKSKARTKITAEMTDAERYNELKDKKITAPYYNGEVDALIADHKNKLLGKTKQEAKSAVISIAKTLGISKTEINFDDVDVKVQVSNSNLSKSIAQDATPEQMAKLLPILVPVAKTAIHIERHENRYYFDNDTVYFDNLLGAYVDGIKVIPIRFGLKHSGMGTTTLYVFVDQNAILKSSLNEIKNSTGRQDATPDNSGVNNLHRRAIYSISEIIPFVKSKDLLRYLPDQMLSTEQKTAKWEAIAETIRKTNEKNDKKYAEYISKGDERSARQMVKAAAKSKGYTDVVYHGTKNFGFTEFDPEKSDDKLSIFVAGVTELAQTYSGKQGTKKVSDNKNIDSLSNDEVVKMLNEESSESYEGEELQTEYEIMNLSDVNKLINEVNAGIEDLQKVVDSKIKEYADRMASDFNDADAKTHSRLVEAKNLLDAYEYKRLSTPLYVLMHYTDAFESNPEVADVEYKIRLMNKLTDADTSNGVVVKKDLGGYGVSVLTFDKAREELKALISSGNYALYGKPGKQLVIDAKGQNWNKIKNWIQSAYRSTNDTYVKKDDSYYRLYDSNTDEQLFHGRTEITEYNKDISIDTLHPVMVQKANNVLAIRSEYMRTTRDIAKFAKDEGYDSVKFENLEDNGGAGESVGASDVYVYFNPSDLKSADTITYDDNGNVIPLSERFNEQSKDIRHKSRSYTSGQVAQVKANLSHNKVYSKKSAMELVSKIAPNIRNRSFEALSDQLWQGLNTYTSLDDKRQFAKDMAGMFVDRMMVDTLVKHSEWDKAVERMAYIKPAINSINLRDEDISELKYILDKDYSRLRGRWGYKTPSNGEFKRPYGLDEFITDLSREMPGMEHLAEMHPAEALIEVDKLYTELSEQIKEKYESAYNDVPDAFIDEMRQSIEYEIMSAYTELGERTKISKYLFEKFEYYESRVQYWKGENAKTRIISRWNGILSTKAMHIRELKKGAFYNATQYHKPDLFKNSIEQLANIQWRGNISPKSIRKVFADLKQWYTKDNPMLYREGADNNLYSDTIAKYIDTISDTEKGAFDANTYAMVYDVMNHLYIMMRNYNKIFRAGRWEDAPDLAKAYLKVMEDNKRNRSAIGRVKDSYINEFLEPMAVAKRADNYNADGFYTQTVKEMREASIAASIGEMRLRKKYDTFIDENKKYLTNAAKETVKYRGFDIPKIHLIGLYMTMKREHARAGLAKNGFKFYVQNRWWDSADKVEVPGFLPNADNQDMINAATEEQMKIIEKSFTDVDKQYIEILETLFNEDLRNLKVERDMERQGYTNATVDYYYPIIRIGAAESIDTTKISDQNRATNASFNKNTIKGSEQALVIISADAMVNRHITDMCKYYYMSQAFENFNVLYNCDVSGNPNNPVNIATFAKEAKIWEKDKDYFRKLVADMQGIREPQSQIERALEKFRGNYAKFALGLNAKVLATQFSSIIAAGNVLGFKSLVSLDNFKVSSADIDKYCPIASVRSYEKVALKAMSVTDKLDKTTELFTSAISVVDSFVIKRLFASCQIEAEKRGEGNLGTEQNKIAAGKILEQVIIETQQNSYATERSQAMRSRNEILKSLTMFTADSMKLISRVHEAAGELRVAMASKDTARIKKARKQLAKSLAVSITSSVYLAAIAVLFNWILAKDDEEKESGDKVLAFALDALGNSISALPGISDLYEMIVNGFEVESATFDTINNVLKGVSNITKDAHNLITGNGETSIEDVNRDLRALLYGIGQMSGIPVRNVYNLSRGILDKFSPKATYYLDSKFYETSLKTDFEKAVEEGNMPKSTYILSLLYDDRIESDVSMAQRKEIIRLTKNGYNVLPKSIPDEVKRNGETYVLTDTQKDAIAKEYSKVVPALDKLMSSSFYSARSDKDKAYLIDYYHDKYYDIAVDKVLGIRDNKVAVYNTVGFSTYAKLAYLTKGIESDKDKDGNVISGSKKAKLLEIVNKTSIPEGKKLLYIASLGYSLSDEDKQKLCKYLNSLSIGDSTKRKLAEVCGLTYKKGKITP